MTGGRGFELRRHPVVAVVWVLASLFAIFQLGRLASFMIDPARTYGSALPGEFTVHHSCFSAYFEAARLLPDVPNIYDPRVYMIPGTTDYRSIGPFELDEFLYPPPFLLLPRLALRASRNFFVLRGAWFAFELTFLIVALAGIARFAGPIGRRAMLIGPGVLAALPTLITLQFGNFQLAAICAAMLAMVAFESGLVLLGASVLAFVTWAKIFPGILLIHLAMARRWRAIGWTAAFGAFYFALALWCFGRAPFAAFFTYELPRIGSGEAFQFLTVDAASAAINDSVGGLVLKLRALGVPGATRGAAAFVSWVFTAVVVGAACLRAPSTRLERSQFWLALLVLASFRSPFAPQEYALFAPIWLCTLVAAGAPLSARAWIPLTLAWLVLNAVFPYDGPVQGKALIFVATVPQVVALALAAHVVFRSRRQAIATPAT